MFRFDHIKPDSQFRQRGLLLQQLLRGANDFFLLDEINGSSGAAEFSVIAYAHFCYHEHVTIAGDDVELATAAAPIAQQHLQARKLEHLGCCALGSAA